MMKRLLTIMLALVALGVAAGNRLHTAGGTMDAPEGYVYNKELSDNMELQVYAGRDGAIAFGTQKAEKDITPSAVATVLANSMMKDGEHTAMTSVDGTPVHLVYSKENRMTLAIIGDRNDPEWTVVIFSGEAGEAAPRLLKTYKKK